MRSAPYARSTAPEIAAERRTVFRNDNGDPHLANKPLKPQTATREKIMDNLPVDRALSIYGALADRSETKGTRELLSRYLMKRYTEGEKDHHRLTVEGLSYLQELDRESDSRS